MRGIALSFVMVAFASGGVFAGTVSFDPDKASVLPGENAVFDVSISAGDTQGFNNLSVLMGSLSDLPLSFVYDPTFVASTTSPPPAPGPFFVYSTDLFVGGNKDDGVGWDAPVLIGRLTVDTTGLVAGESASVVVDAQFEFDNFQTFLSNLNGTEPIFGTGTINIVPEPATLVLLGLGGIVALRRRRSAL